MLILLSTSTLVTLGERCHSSLRPVQKGQLISVRNYRPVAISSRAKLDRLLFEMINLFALIIFICSACLALASERELGHPLCRTFTAHDYVEGLGQISSITEDPQGRILFGCEDAILVFDKNRWEPIATPETVYIRSFAADRDGVIWFSNSTQIGYLSRVDGGYRRVKVYEGSLGDSRVIVNGDRLYFTSDSGLLTWDNCDMSQQPLATDAMTKFSAAAVHGKICSGDRNGSIYEPDGGRITKIAESSSAEAGKVLAIVDCPIGDALIVRSLGTFRKTGATPYRRQPTSILR
jgi:hypothetical protein